MKRWLKEMCGLDFMLVAVPKGESLAKLAIHALVVQQVRLPWETYQHVVGDDGIERHCISDFITDRFAEVTAIMTKALSPELTI